MRGASGKARERGPPDAAAFCAVIIYRAPRRRTHSPTTPTHLWRHVVERAGARDGALLAQVDREPKVGELERQPPVGGAREKYVFGLDVAVHDAAAVQVLLVFF